MARESLTTLEAKVVGAREEFDLAVIFHETWKPTAYDEALHARLGVSYASHSFNVVRLALRREMVLALTRVWDKNKKTVGLESVVRSVCCEATIEELVAARVASIGIFEARPQIAAELKQRAADALAIVGKYSRTGAGAAVRAALEEVRNAQLAHRKAIATAATPASTSDEEIESFFLDTSELVRLLSSLVSRMAYDPQDTAGVYRHYAKYFWAVVRGEKTEGHPNFRPPAIEAENNK